MAEFNIHKADAKGRVSLGKSAAGKFFVSQKVRGGFSLREYDPSEDRMVNLSPDFLARVIASQKEFGSIFSVTESPESVARRLAEEIPSTEPAPPVRPIVDGTVRDLD